LDSAHYKSVGKYKNDDPTKSGVTLDGKIIKRKHTGIHVTPNLSSKRKNTIRGTTVLDTSTNIGSIVATGNSTITKEN
jgi:ribosomal protein L35